MDYVIIESEDKSVISNITLIEFMKSEIDNDHIERTVAYSKWVNEALAIGSSVTRPIIICYSSDDYLIEYSDSKKQNRINKKKQMLKELAAQNNLKPIEIYTFDFSLGKPIFVRKK